MKRIFTTVIVFGMMLIASIAWSKIIHVPGDQPTIQAGIDAAVNGDIVLVANDTWTGPGNKNLDFGGKAITVTSENGPGNCIIDCEGNGRGFHFYSGETSESVLKGFTITNASSQYGSGIHIESEVTPLIEHNIITNNVAEQKGGGIFVNGASPILRNNSIINNSAEKGGGIYFSASSSLLENNLLQDNTADMGGGVFCISHPSVEIRKNVFTDNSATQNGGAIYCEGSYPLIVNNVVTESSGQGAIYFNFCNMDWPIVINNTIVNNLATNGTIICFTSKLKILNTVLWNNGHQILPEMGSEVQVSYSCIRGGWAGEGNINADPMFVDPDNGDYHLQPGSPCIDAGTPEGAPDSDKDGNPRDRCPDMGSYEYQIGQGSITIISPNDGEQFPLGAVVDVIVEVRNELGEPKECIEVTFTATGGTVSPDSDITDANGQAETQLTVAEGENIVTATVTDYPDITDTITVIGVVPTIERISPEIGQLSGGDEVTITGNYFQDGATVTIGGNPATEVTVDSETQITARIPTGELGITDVVVTNPDEQSATFSRGFAYIPMYGDVSGNRTVSAYDAALILQFVVGLINTFPVSIIQSPEQITPRNYTVSLSSLSARAGKQIQAPIAINDAKGLTAGGIILKYDPTILQPTQVASTLSGTYWKANTNIAGEIRFAFASTEPTSGTEKILIVEFEALPNTEGQSSPLILDTVQLSGSLNITKVNGMVTILPSQSLLLQNYPNPFNPETWIPYQLAYDSPVTVSIYNAKGQMIRAIFLDTKQAGVYVKKDKAAYWDGRNSEGSRVASGVYFYTLQAGEFRATQKMVIIK